ncbi:hypothetical protein KC365_g3958 [Hortaea werneckii]|nr:hypothetical protein KC365_g3958 [Hortaea werneckii]
MPAQNEDTRSEKSQEGTPRIAKVISFAQDLVDRRLGNELERHPRLVLVGNQSSTKRRIAEAACDTVLSIAENQEFCCPLQITTSASEEPWTCTVKLRRYFAYSPHSEVKETGFQSWIQCFCRPFLFEQAVSKEQLADTLERANCAALSPSCDPNDFRKGKSIPKPQVTFSSNPIHLEITGPGLSELTFIDLPSAKGIGDGVSSERLLSGEGNLIKLHLDDKQTLILLVTVSEPEQTTLDFIRKSGAAERCMCVFPNNHPQPSGHATLANDDCHTRAEGKSCMRKDWQVSSQFSQWQQIVEDSQKEEALSAEQSWSEGSTGQELWLDTAALQATMSRRLESHIRKSLDGTAKTIENSLSAVHKLRAYPSRLQPFIDDISNRVESFNAIDSPGNRSPMSELLESHKIALDALHTIYPVTIEEAMHINEDVTRRYGLKALQEDVIDLDLKAGGQKKAE